MYIDEAVKKQAEVLFKNERPNMGHALGIVYESLKKEEVVATMPVNENTVQPYGLLHGGASAALAETLASVGGVLNVDAGKQMVVGIEINANHLKAVRSGKVRGTATPIHRGARTQVWEIKIRTETGKLVCVSRCTLAVVARRD